MGGGHAMGRPVGDTGEGQTMTRTITFASVCSIALYVALFVYVGAWPLVVVGAFAVLVVVAAVAGLRWEGAP